jgi:site-specific recombinase XerD
LIEGFLLSCRVENKSPATVSFYKGILDKFQWFLKKYGIDTLDPITIRSFLAYVKDSENRWDSTNTRANRKVCPYTVERYFTGLSALFRWSMEEGLIEANPMQTIKKPKVPRKIVKGLEADKIHTLLSSFTCNSITDYRNKAILFVFLDTGLRLAELSNMKLSDIAIEKGIIKVMGKGNKERLVRVGLKTQKALWTYLASRQSSTIKCRNGEATFSQIV